MKYNPDIHHRQSLRWEGCDYSQEGGYFVTICTYERECLFGEVIEERVELNEVGKTVLEAWSALSARFPTLALDEMVVMANHVHGIIFFRGAANGAKMNKACTDKHAPTLGLMMRAFKSISAIQANRLRQRAGQPLWQRNYYDHVIRDDDDLNRIREYIIENPKHWKKDEENPVNW